MHTNKPKPGQPFPKIEVPQVGGGSLDLGERSTDDNWKLLVVYRGRHCPICTRYLNELNAIVPQLAELGVDVAAVSADSEARANEQLAQVNPDFPVGHNLSIPQMEELGLYISSPRHGMDVEAPFAEPGLFVIDQTGETRVADISNVPFARPDLGSMLKGITFMRGMKGDFPANGTYA